MDQATKEQQLHALEQNIQITLTQKQHFQSQLLEVQTAKKEIAQTDETFKFIGNIMVKVTPEKLTEELTEKESLYQKQIEVLQKQHTMLTQRREEIEKETRKE